MSQAVDIQAQLDSSDGTSGFTIQALNNTGVDRIDSHGNVGVGTTTPLALLYVAPAGATGPEYLQLGGGVGSDAYVANDMAVDGTAYFNNVQVDGELSATGIHFSGQQTLDSITVTGSAFLGTTSGNVGIGTTGQGNFFSVGSTSQFRINASGAITAVTGIVSTGAYTQTSGGNNSFSAHLGVGVANPGEALDVLGTVRSTGLTMSGSSPISGYVLTATDSAGNVTWSSAGGVAGWTTSSNDVYETMSGNVGIGTNITNNAALSVMNGNVGIGTWAPSAPFTVGLNAFTVNMAGAVTATTGITTSGGYTQSGTNGNSLNGNVGIGTITLNNKLSVLGGAGFGSYATNIAPNGGIITSGNVGVGSSVPGTMLDVTGTVRSIGLTMSGSSPISGYVLTATDSAGNVTWSSAGSVSGWSEQGNDVYETLQGNVGIGTTITNNAALSVMNGNVGIGTWAPSAPLTVGANAFMVNSSGAITTSGGYTQTGTSGNSLNGNVGIGTITLNNKLSVLGGAGFGSYATNIAPNGGIIISGNVGIGSSVPGTMLDVTGTVRSIGLTMSGSSPISGYVLTATDSAGNVTWSSAGSVSGWSEQGNDVYETLSGNVGIGTTVTNNAALSVMNGNVGIGTWAPSAPLTVGANAFMVNSSGAITAMTGITTSGGYTQTGTSGNSLNGNVGIGTITLNNKLSVLGGAGFGSYATNIAPNGGIITSGNVGIGSSVPGTMLDVTGTVRSIGLTMSGSSPISGYVLTATDSAGNVTWSSAGAVSGWTQQGNDVYETLSGNVGIGTTNTTSGALTVMNGNVGIGTWVPGSALSVMSGNIAIGITTPAAPLQINAVPTGSGELELSSPSGTTSIAGFGVENTAGHIVTGSSIGDFSILANVPATGKINFSANAGTSAQMVLTNGGNVGISSTAPGQALDVTGTARVTGNVGIGSSITDNNGTNRLTIAAGVIEINLQ